MAEKIVTNTSPLLALSKMEALDVVGELPLEFFCPTEVQLEILAGAQKHFDISIPDWVTVVSLKSKLSPLASASLDEGEAAVISLALELGIKTVCIDELAGRRAAKAVGLGVVGSLGLLGRAKSLGIIANVEPYIQRAIDQGIYYDKNLISEFVSQIDEK